MLPLAGWGLHQARKLVPHRMGRLGDTCLCAMWHFWGRPLTVGSGRGRGGLVHHPGARWHEVPTASTWLSGPLPLLYQLPKSQFCTSPNLSFFFPVLHPGRIQLERRQFCCADGKLHPYNSEHLLFAFKTNGSFPHSAHRHQGRVPTWFVPLAFSP